MRKEYKRILIYLMVGIIVYYVIPFAFMLINSDVLKSALFLCLFIINPLYNLLCSFMYTVKSGFKVYFPLVIGILFIPSVFIVYNSSALFYFIFYVILGYVGYFVGRCLKND